MIGIVKTINGVKQLVPLTTDSGQGLPLGAWTSFEDDKPRNGYLKAGTTFNQSDYPALYTMLGSNVVPERYWYGNLDYEHSSSISPNATPYTISSIDFDGIIIASLTAWDGWANDSYVEVTRNGVTTKITNSAFDGGTGAKGSITFPVEKGDSVKFKMTFYQHSQIVCIPYEKHPMFIKAVIGPIEDSAADQVLVQAKNAMFPDYARGNLFTASATSYTMPEDGYVVFGWSSNTADATHRLMIDGQIVSPGNWQANVSVCSFCGFVKKGSVLSYNGSSAMEPQFLKVFGLI